MLTASARTTASTITSPQPMNALLRKITEKCSDAGPTRNLSKVLGGF